VLEEGDPPVMHDAGEAQAWLDTVARRLGLALSSRRPVAQ
jgi:hypothetical protein